MNAGAVRLRPLSPYLPALIQSTPAPHSAYNHCLDLTQPNPNFSGCSAERDTCLIGARYQRLARSAKTGRLL
jgi:hypothetical protein